MRQTLRELCEEAVANGITAIEDIERGPSGILAGHQGFLWPMAAAAIREQDASGAWEFITEADRTDRGIPDLLADALERKHAGYLGLLLTRDLLLDKLFENALAYARPAIEAALTAALEQSAGASDMEEWLDRLARARDMRAAR